MSELMVHLKKDIRGVRMESSLLILLAIILMGSVFLAYNSVLQYLSSSYGLVITTRLMQTSLNYALTSYWNEVITFQALLLLIFSSCAFGNEKESGMLKFTLAFGADKRRVYLSKFLLLVIISAIALIGDMLVFVIMITATGSLPLDVGVFFTSSFFVLNQFIVVISLGILISSLTKKKTTAIVLAIAFMIGSMAASSFLMNAGLSDSWADFNQEKSVDPSVVYNSEYIIAHFPIKYSIPLFMLPWRAPSDGMHQSINIESDPYNSSGTYLLSMEGNLLVCLGLIVMYLGIGYLLFSRERKTYGSLLASFSGKRGPSEGKR
ncbi:MAG: ABC-2 family transporter protein [Methanomassiliicoccales archaeon PtaU1.Bin124]|nr:MAG: ABC-2 family transporter protein [Methanomassiliicoccales archaeon PtaU1.Bin124]